MCEYCGCQEVEAIAALTAEHDEIRSVAHEAGQAARRADHAAAVMAARHLLALLEPHVRIEELGLFPAMAREFGEHTDLLVSEHRQVETVLADVIASDPAQSGWIDTLNNVVSELFEHILREQDGLFPAAMSVLTSSDWEVLDDVRTTVTGTVRQ